MGSDANRMRLSYLLESAYGVPTVGPMIDLRYTGESLKQTSAAVKSQEIRSDRQISDVIRTDVGAEGDVNIEMSFGAYDDLLAAALFASLTWSSPVTVTASTISAAAVDNSFNDSGSGFGSLAVGQWVKVSGFTGAGITANSGFFKILTKTAAKITVSGGTLIDDAAGESVTIKMGEQILNGTTGSSFTIEKKYTDLTNKFAKNPGMYVGGHKQSIKSDQIITGSFSFLGQKEVSTAATVGNGSYTAAPTNEVMAGVEDIFGVVNNGSVLTDISSLDFSLNNNLRKRTRIGSLGPFSIGSGTIDIDGAVNMYLASEAMIDQYLNFTDSSLAVMYKDSAGKSYVVEWPSIKFTDGQRVAGGINTDIMADMKFMAKMHPTEGITMRITRWT